MGQIVIALSFFLVFLAMPDALAAKAPVVSGEMNFATLINQHAQGTPAQSPWVGYWWPFTEGGVASARHSADGLSPIEKYDAAYRAALNAQGRETAQVESAAEWEQRQHGPHVSGLQTWHGHATGWATASILFAEPRAAISLFGVTFGVADVKALLSEAADGARGATFGRSVESAQDQSSARFNDVAPNQFFLALTNEMGRLKRGIVMDRHAGHEVWNVPIAGYAFDYPTARDDLGADARYRNLYRVAVRARVWWTSNNVAADETAPPFDLARLRNIFDDRHYPGRQYSMVLWLDGPLVFDVSGKLVSSGNVVQLAYGTSVDGGYWTPDASAGELIHAHPDTMFIPQALGPAGNSRNPRLDVSWVAEKLARPGTRSGN